MVGGAGEDAREDQCKLEAWNIAVALDGVDALAGNTRSLRELLLRPTAGGTKLFDSVDDGWHGVKLTFQIRIAWNGFGVKLAFHFLFGLGFFTAPLQGATGILRVLPAFHAGLFSAAPSGRVTFLLSYQSRGCHSLREGDFYLDWVSSQRPYRALQANCAYSQHSMLGYSQPLPPGG